MKSIILLAVMLMVGCASMMTHEPTVPAGYKVCHSDLDCIEGQVCGFLYTDTYAVCK